LDFHRLPGNFRFRLVVVLERNRQLARLATGC
jgi:hypothetical protein